MVLPTLSGGSGRHSWVPNKAATLLSDRGIAIQECLALAELARKTKYCANLHFART